MKRIFHLFVVADYYLAAVLLIWAGGSKIFKPLGGDLLEALLNRNIINIDQLVLISRWTPPMETLLGIAALTGMKAIISARLTASLYLFYAMLLMVVSEGYFLLPIDCGCFNGGETTPVYLPILRNIIIALPLFFFPAEIGRFSRPNLLFAKN